MYLGRTVDVNNDLINIQRCAKITKWLHTYAHIPRSTRNPCQYFSGQIMQCKQGQTHNLPKRWYNTLTANRVKNVCAYTARIQTNTAQAFSECRHRSRHQPFLNTKIKTIPYNSAPPHPRRQPRRKHEKGKSAALPARDGLASAQPPGAPFDQNINFPEIRRHYATAKRGVQTSPVYVPARGRCNQSNHLKVASPLLKRQQKFM